MWKPGLVDRLSLGRVPTYAPALLIVVAVLGWNTILLHGVATYEFAAFAMDPNASRAVAYGDRHFNTHILYDVDRAEMYYTKALALDPDHAYAYHQLARISFLRGDFFAAFAFINTQIRMHGDAVPNSYYIRGLIEGYMGSYAKAAEDYEHYLAFDPDNWAAINDYAWVLIQAERYNKAARTAARGLKRFPDNPWLLNTHAIAHYELGHYATALASARKAALQVEQVSTQQWLTAYPGNDPRIAVLGISTFKEAVIANVHTIETALASDTIQ